VREFTAKFVVPARGRPLVPALMVFWLMMIVACGVAGLFGFAGFYAFVIGIDCVPKLIEGMMPIYPIALIVMTFLEVLQQRLFKQSLFENIAVAMLILSVSAIVGGLIQFLLPVMTRLDDISYLFGFDERHVSALVCEYVASTLAVVCGMLAFAGVRDTLRRANWIF